MKNKYFKFVILFLILVSFVSFNRIIGNDFINFDDMVYITQNNHVQSGINAESIKWAFTAVVTGNWHPLTLISHILDWSLFGANASGHHLVNLFLHIGAVIFLFLFLNKTTKSLWPAAFAAAFFALHPLRVESVAWASERKDVLSVFFGMACLYTYACYAENSKLSRYALCLILFALALMSKPMLVTLPFVLMLLDYWPLERWQKLLTPVNIPIATDKKSGKKKFKEHKADSTSEKRTSTYVPNHSQIIGSLLWEKVPFFFLALASSNITLWAQHKGDAYASLQVLPFAERLSNAIVSYVSYLGKTFWPVDLAILYPYNHSIPPWQFFGAVLILLGISIVVIYAFKKVPFLFVGWFWYLGTLIPVIGLVQVGEQAMADRYTYLPSIGIAVMLAWGIPFLFQCEDMRKKILFPAGIAVLAILAVLTWKQCGYWKNSVELWDHALQVTKDNYMAHINIGHVFFTEGKTEEAIDNYSKAIRLKPDWADAYNSRGVAHCKLGQYQRAFEDFNQTIRVRPDNADAYLNRGITYGELGQYQHALEDFNEAIQLKPDYADAYYNRGITYLIQGNKKLGCYDAQKACTLGNCKVLERAKSMGDCN